MLERLRVTVRCAVPRGRTAGLSEASRCSFFTRGRSDAGDAGQELRLLLTAVAAQARFQSAILDGEICGWDKEAAEFTEFRTVRPIFGAAGRRVDRNTIIRSGRGYGGSAEHPLPPILPHIRCSRVPPL